MSHTLDEAAIVAAMPPVAREMVALVGFAATMDLCREFGGINLWIAKVLADESEIVRRFGRTAADILASKYGGSHVDVPLLHGVSILLRDNAIRADYDAQVPTQELCRRYRIGQRHLYRLLKASASVEPRCAQPPIREPRAFDHLDKAPA